MNNFKKKTKHFLAIFLSLVTFLSTMQFSNTVYAVTAPETATARLCGLEYVGTVDCGGKEESGNWLQTRLGSTDVFCLDLGDACRSGDSFKQDSETIYVLENDKITNISNTLRNRLYAKLGAWYKSKNFSKTAWVYTQIAIWTMRNSSKTGDELKAEVIKAFNDISKSSPYYIASGKEVYNSIDTIQNATTVTYTYKYTGKNTTGRQDLFYIEGEVIVETYKLLSEKLPYRQRITLHKENEAGADLSNIEFSIEIKNKKEFDSLKINGWGNAETVAEDDSDVDFIQTASTDSDGKITFKCNYVLNSKEYAYVPSGVSELEKNAIIEEIKKSGYKYGDDYSESAAKELANDELQDKLKKVNNKYIITETSAPSNYLIDNRYASGYSVELGPKNTWTKVNGEWPETTDETYGNYSSAYKPTITNIHDVVSLSLTKKNGANSSNVAGATYRLYSNAECTIRATNSKNVALSDITTNASGLASLNSFEPNKANSVGNITSGNFTYPTYRYYAKEISTKNNKLEVNPEVYVANVVCDSFAETKPIVNNVKYDGIFRATSNTAGPTGSVNLENAYDFGFSKVSVNKYDGNRNGTNVITVAGATYTLYENEACTTPVKYNYPYYVTANTTAYPHARTDVVTFTTDSKGQATSDLFYPTSKTITGGTADNPTMVVYAKETNMTGEANYREQNPTVYPITISYNSTGSFTAYDYGVMQLTLTKQDKQTNNGVVNATFTAYEDAECTKPVKYNYPDYIKTNTTAYPHAKGDTVTFTTGEDGKATSDVFYPSTTASMELKSNIPQYTYYVKETVAPNLYYIENNLKKVTIVHKMTTSTYKDTATADSLINVDDEYNQDTTTADNYYVRGWAELFKEDSRINGFSEYSFLNNPLTQTKSGVSQFAGAVYELTAAEDIHHPDNKTTGKEMGISNCTEPGLLFKKGDVIKSAMITGYDGNKPIYKVINNTGRYAVNENGYLQIGSSEYDEQNAEDLWVGNYNLKEVVSNTITYTSDKTNKTYTYNYGANGYLADDTTYKLNVAYAGQNTKKVKATVSPSRFVSATNIVKDGPNGNLGNNTLIISKENSITQKFSLVKESSDETTTDATRLANIKFYVKSRLDLGRYCVTDINGNFLDKDGNITTNPNEYQPLYKLDSYGDIVYDNVYKLYDLESYTQDKVDGFGNKVNSNISLNNNGTAKAITKDTENWEEKIKQVAQYYLDENRNLKLDPVIGDVTTHKNDVNKLTNGYNCKIIWTGTEFYISIPQYKYTENAAPNDGDNSKINSASQDYGQYEYWNDSINYGPDMITSANVTKPNGVVNVDTLKLNYNEIDSKPSQTNENGVLYSIPLPYGFYVVQESEKDAQDLDVDAVSPFDITIDDASIQKYGAYEDDSLTNLDGSGAGNIAFKLPNDLSKKFFIQLAKHDADSGELVLFPGATFEIYKIEYKEIDGEQQKQETLVKHKAYINNVAHYSTYWKTDESGRVFLQGEGTDSTFTAGEYIIKEIHAPYGYYLCNNTLTSKYVSPDFNTINFYVDTDKDNNIIDITTDEKYTHSLHINNTAYEVDKDGDFITVIDDYNQPVKGRIKITKKGPSLISLNQNTYTGFNTWATFNYEEQSLPGATYEVRVAETVYTPDHQYRWDDIRTDFADKTAEIIQETQDEEPVSVIKKYADMTDEELINVFNDMTEEELSVFETYRVIAVANGVKLVKGAVVDTITTAYAAQSVYDEYLRKDVTWGRGEAVSCDLPLGSYNVVEVKAPYGCVLPEKEVDRTQLTTVTYEDEHIPLVFNELTFKNEKQKVNLSVTKIDDEDERAVKGANFELSVDGNGIYNTDDTLDPQRKLIVNKDTKIEKETTDEKGKLTFSAGLAAYNSELDNDTLANGLYYTKELGIANGYYSLSDKVQNSLKYDAQWTVKESTKETLERNLTVRNIPTIVRFEKVDYYTNVPIGGTTLQVIDPNIDENGDYVTDENGKIVGTVIDEWTTKADDEFTWYYDKQKYKGHAVERLQVGHKYILREVQASDGYVNISKALDKVKNANVGYDDTYKDTFFTVNDCTYNTDGVITSDMQTVTMKNDHITGRIIVNKSGEVLTSVTINEAFDMINNLIHYTFGYTEGNLKDVTYEITAESDIKHPDKVSKDYYKADDLVQKITTDIFGYAISDELPLGSYNVEEVTAADGFVRNTKLDNVVLSEDNQFVRVVYGDRYYVNDRQKVDVVINKKSAMEDENKYVNDDDELVTEDKLLSGAVYGLFAGEDIFGYKVNEVQDVSYDLDTQNKTTYDSTSKTVEETDEILLKEDELIETVTTDENGVAHFTSDLPLGKYYVKEIKAPNGYHTSDYKYTVYAYYEDQDLSTISAEYDIYDLPTHVEITKLIDEARNKEELEESDYNVGATLEILDSNERVVDSWVTTNKPHYVNHLVVNEEYTLVETKPADGYVTARPIKFKVDDYKMVEVILEAEMKKEPIDLQRLTMYDEHTKVEFSKTDITTGKEIPGATLQIIDKDGNVVEEWVTDGTKHLIEYLPIGNYKLVETLAPTSDGYVKAEDIDFTVNDTGMIQKVEMKDDYTKVEFSKTNITTGKELPGATLQVVDSNGNVIDEWISTNKPHTINYLPIGTYTLVETQAPTDKGYVKSESVQFTVRETGITQQVEMKDDYTKVQISKKDITNGDELPGAKLKIVDADGNLVDQWTSTDKPHLINYLPTGKYTLIETDAPDGYVTSRNVKFTIKETSEIQTVVMKDDVTKVKVSKKDMTTKKELPGAKLEIIDNKGNVVEKWTSTNKPHYIEKLPTGKYTLVETTAPNGYKISEKVKFTVKDSGKIVKVTMYDERKPNLTTTNKTGDTNSPLILFLGLAFFCSATYCIYYKKKEKNK